MRLLDHGQVGAQVYLVMELVSGAPFPGPGRHTWEQLRGPVMSLLGTLAQLHTRGFVHRDLKPDNLRLCANGEVVVLDFGLVRRPARDPGLTEGAAGTPRYLPPEQITGGNLDGRSDIYALGVMLYEALTGVDPWEGLELEQRLAARLYQASPKMPADPSLPPGLTRLIDRMLSRDWLLRPSAAELLAELEEGQGDSIDSYTEEIVQDVLRRVAAGERIAIWGPAAARPERLLHRINHLRPEAVLLPPGGRPYTSLLLAFADAQRDEDPTEALSVVLRHCPLLLIPDWEGLDRQSRSLVERIAGPQVCIQAHPTAIRLQPLPHDVLMQYFEGPDLLLHLREDAATELLRRTDGWPAAVQTVLG
ncbi:MAG TPA: serine/threonine-protein kinase, partial [Myxococcota bacterium]|nr:serine/threonine-protein kinase [Myxococcota bacterium]